MIRFIIIVILVIIVIIIGCNYYFNHKENFINKTNIIPNLKNKVTDKPYNALNIDVNDNNLYTYIYDDNVKDFIIYNIPLDNTGNPDINKNNWIKEGASGYPILINKDGNIYNNINVTIGYKYQFMISTNKYVFYLLSNQPQLISVQIIDINNYYETNSIFLASLNVNNMFTNGSYSNYLWLIDNNNYAYSLNIADIENIDNTYTTFLNTFRNLSLSNFIKNSIPNVIMASNFKDLTLLLAKNNSIYSPYLVSRDNKTSILLTDGLPDNINIIYICTGNEISWCTNGYNLYYIVNEVIFTNPIWILYDSFEKKILQMRNNNNVLFMLLDDTVNNNIVYVLNSRIDINASKLMTTTATTIPTTTIPTTTIPTTIIPTTTIPTTTMAKISSLITNPIASEFLGRHDLGSPPTENYYYIKINDDNNSYLSFSTNINNLNINSDQFKKWGNTDFKNLFTKPISGTLEITNGIIDNNNLFYIDSLGQILTNDKKNYLVSFSSTYFLPYDSNVMVKNSSDINYSVNQSIYDFLMNSSSNVLNGAIPFFLPIEINPLMNDVYDSTGIFLKNGNYFRENLANPFIYNNDTNSILSVSTINSKVFPKNLTNDDPLNVYDDFRGIRLMSYSCLYKNGQFYNYNLDYKPSPLFADKFNFSCNNNFILVPIVTTTIPTTTSINTEKPQLPTINNQCNPLGVIVDKSLCNTSLNCIYADNYCYELNSDKIGNIDKTNITCIITKNTDGTYNLNFKSTTLNKLYIIKKIDFLVKNYTDPDNPILSATLINLDLNIMTNKNNIYIIDTNGNMFIKLKLFSDNNDSIYNFIEIKLTDINNKKITLSETSSVNTILNKSNIQNIKNTLNKISYDNSFAIKTQNINKNINDSIINNFL